MVTLRKIIVIGALVGVVAACSDDPSSTDTTAAATTELTSVEPVDTTVLESVETTVAETAPQETTPQETTPAAAGWETIVAPADCMCADGSEFSYFVRKANPAKVMFFFEGGGACFNAQTCNPASATYKQAVGGGASGNGIFDFDNALNPFADYSIVYVPYCTGDVHIGNTTTDYGDGVVIEHKGYINGTSALDSLVELFPDVTELVVTGESAGSIPSPLYAGLAADLLPNARIAVLADGSGAYPDLAGLNPVVGGAWGVMNAVPDWPTNADVTPENWSLPGLFIRAHQHAPDITFARHDYAFDAVQTLFMNLLAIPTNDLPAMFDANEAQIEAAGVELWSFVSPGAGHTVLSSPSFYTETLDGTALVDWVTDFVAGDEVADVRCTVCTA